MSGTHVELRVSFTVSSDLDDGREQAEGLLRRLESLADHGDFDRYTGDFEVTRGSVNGNGWEERWPDKPAPPAPAPWPPEGFVDLGFVEPNTVIQIPPGVTGAVWME